MLVKAIEIILKNANDKTHKIYESNRQSFLLFYYLKFITMNLVWRNKKNKCSDYYCFRNSNKLSFCALNGSMLPEILIYVKSYNKINCVH